METEAQTRKEIIDKKLNDAGWNINDLTQVVTEYDIHVELPEGINEAQTQYDGHQFSDKDGVQISQKEADDLAQLLHEEHPHITEELLQKVYRNKKAHFIQFIRYILGIEILKSFPDTVQEAFDHFIKQHTNLNSRQLEFLNLLKNFIVEREKIEKRDLISAPFTVIHPQGIRGVFTPAEIEEILILTAMLAA